QLSQVSVLDVVSKNGVLPYRGSTLGVDSIGRALKAGSIVRGSVEPAPGGVRVDVRLDDGASGVNLDKKTFTIPSAQLLLAQDTIGANVAELIRKRVGEEIRLREQKLATRSSDAWLLLQQAERLHKDADSLALAGAVPAAQSAYARADSLLARAEAADATWPAPLALRASVAYALAQTLRKDPASLPAVIDSGMAFADRALAINARDPDALEYKGKLQYLQITEHLIADPKEAERTLVAAESTLTRAVTYNKNQAG